MAALAVAIAVSLTGPGATKPTAGHAETTSGAPLRTYVIVLDGLRPRDVTPLLMPNLHTLRSESTWYQQARSVFPAETLPNHAAMITGVLPDRNGIVGNKFIEPEASSSGAADMNQPRFLQIETTISRLERACGSSLNTATVMAKAYLWSLFGTGGIQPAPTAPKNSAGDPRNGQLTADFHWNPYPLVPVSEATIDQHTMQNGFLPWMRETGTPQFAWVNLADVDRAGHADGGGSGGNPEFQHAAMKDTDVLIRNFVQELKDQGWWEDTVLILLSDHGMDWVEGSHQAGSARTINLVQWLEGQSGGRYREGAGDFGTANNGAAESVTLYHGNREARAEMIEIIKDHPGVERVLSEREGLTGAAAEGEHPRRLYGLDTNRTGVVVMARPGWRFDKAATIPGNHGHTITQHATLMVTGGHPSLSTVAQPGVSNSSKSVPGAVVWEDGTGPPGGIPLPPQGGPGVLSVTPTLAGLWGLPPVEGGYDGQPLSEAFDEGELSGSHALCPGLGYDSVALDPEEVDGQQEAGEDAGEGGEDRGEGRIVDQVSGSAATSLAANRRLVTHGRSFTLTGRVTRTRDCRAPQWIEIRRRTRGAKQFIEYAEVPIGPGGRWRRELASGPSAAYLAVPATRACSVTASQVVNVTVAARVRILGIRSCSARRPAVWGRVAPSAPGTRVRLQRRQGSRWRAVDSSRLGRRSGFRLRLASCTSGRYRVLWPGQTPGNARGAAVFRV